MSRKFGVCAALLLGLSSFVAPIGCGGDDTGSGGSGASGASGPAAGGQGGVGAEGGGGGADCAVASDCPGMDGPCQTVTCIVGTCGIDLVPNGTEASDQTDGDCKTVVCDGAGSSTSENDDADVLDDDLECTDDTCDAGTPANTPKAEGTACTQNGGAVCAADGTCVECITAEDCTSNICDQNVCVPAACDDAVKNGNETDVDCGGADCAPCADGLVCNVAADCTSGVCTGNVCQVPNCTDLVQNGGETDVDCGSACPGQLCGPGQGCAENKDCKGNSCSGTTCLESCTDVILNQDETDIDCGGAVCTSCDDGLACLVGSDCTSGVCTANVCQVPICGDGVTNGGDLCDDGGTTSGDGCDDICQVEVGYVCMGAPSVCMTVCGDGLIAGTEACDDLNLTPGDGCDAACAEETGYDCTGTPSVCAPICGDGIIIAPEACDDSDATGGDGCSATCTLEAGWMCAGMPSTCNSICGDGIVVGTEACDDGNPNGADGCTACVVDANFTCSGQPSVCFPIQVVSVGPGLAAAIPDDGYTGALTPPSMACVTIPVPAVANNTVGTVTLQVSMSHTWIGDLVLKLVSPANTVVTLMSRPGFAEPADNGTGSSPADANLVFAFPVTYVTGAMVSAEAMDQGLTSLQNVCQQNMVCSFAPANGAAPPGNLTTFAGQVSNGNWAFCAGDSEGADTGIINGATLTITKQ